METKDSRDIEVIKLRSYARCMRDGLTLPLKHFGVMLKLLWPAVLLAVLFFALQRMTQSETIMSLGTPSFVPIIILSLVWGFFAFLSLVVFEGCVVWHQLRMKELGYLPSVHSWHVWRELIGQSCRVLKYALSELLVFTPFAIAIVYFYQTGLWWASVLVAVVLMLVSLALVQVGLEYLLFEVTLGAAIRSLAWSKRYLGRTFLLLFVVSFPLLIIFLLFGLPSMVTDKVVELSLLAQLQGDTTDLPSYFPVLRFVTLIIAGLGSCLTIVMSYYTLCFHWGNIHAIEQERKTVLSDIS